MGKKPSLAVDGPQDFYGQALTQAERLRLPRAREVQGLEEEIALLRVRLLRSLEEHPENYHLLLKGITLLVRAVATQYRISPAAQKQLSDSIAGVLKGVGAQLLPEAFSDAS